MIRFIQTVRDEAMHGPCSGKLDQRVRGWKKGKPPSILTVLPWKEREHRPLLSMALERGVDM